MNEEQLKAMASQLSCPTGEDGIRIADMMYASNAGMIRNTIKSLKLTQQDKVLELGHGNGHHIPEILDQHETIIYYGLEISELMSKEALKFNSDTKDQSKVSFALYDGENLPFEDNYFTKIMTVNTLYFWKNPEHLLNEIGRVLKEGAKFSCAFAPKDFMERLPFTKFIFELYDRKKLERLIQSSPLKLIEFQEYTEQVPDKNGQPVERTYAIAILTK